MTANSEFLCPNCAGVVLDDCPKRECGDYDCYYCPSCDIEYTDKAIEALLWADEAQPPHADSANAAPDVSGGNTLRLSNE